MINWAPPNEWVDGAVDLEIIEESALAMAQSTIQNAITKSGLSRAEMARRMQCNRSLVSRLLNGSHNLTVKTMARSMAVCGFEFRLIPVSRGGTSERNNLQPLCYWCNGIKGNRETLQRRDTAPPH